MKKIIFLVGVLILIALAYKEYNPHRWESAIRAFEERDKKHPPKEGAVLFIGSSSIRMWKTVESDFPFVDVMNRGFGGSQMDDLIFFADRIIIPYRPRLIVIYEGDNDIFFGRSPEKVLKDFRMLVQKIHKTLPETHIAFISIKPSPARWENVEDMKRANELIRSYTQEHQKLGYIDVFFPMIGSNGRPRQELFLEDRLHLSQKGYTLWVQIIEPYLKRLLTINE